MQDGQEHGAFDGELETAAAQEFVEHGPATGFLPEFFKDQGRTPTTRMDYGEMALAMLGEDEDFLSEAGPGGQQAVDLATVLDSFSTVPVDFRPLMCVFP